MEDVIIIFYVVLGILIFISIIFYIAYLSRKAEKKKAEELKQFASSHGYDYLEKDGDLEKYVNFDFINKHKSSNLRVLNVLSKRDMSIFEFKHLEYTGKHTTEITHLVFISNLKDAPDFFLSKEKLYHKIGDYIGFKDIDFKKFPVFSDKYYLKGKDEKAIRSFFSDRKLSSMEHYYLGPWNVEVKDEKIAFFKNGSMKKDYILKFEGEFKKLLNILK